MTDETAGPALPALRFELNRSMSVTLDGIRALSAQAVVFGHAISFFAILPLLQPPHAPFMQNIGVVVFFVLSGFLIAYTVFRKVAAGPYPFLTYAVERFARIFSGFIPGLALIAVVDGGVIIADASRYPYPETYSVGMLVANIAMLEDHSFTRFVADFLPSGIAPVVAGITTFGTGRPLWTLAIEWWIYMAFGWLALAGAVRSRHPIRYLAVLALVVAIPAYNLIGGRGHSLTLMWLTGAVTFWLVLTYPPRWSARMSWIGAAAFGVAAALRVKLVGDAYDLAFACLLAAALYFMLSALRLAPIGYPTRMTRVIQFVAGYSLTLYVVHYTILSAFVVADPDWPKPVLLLVSIVCCNIVAAVIAWPTEMRHKQFAKWLLARIPGSGSPGPRPQRSPAASPTAVGGLDK